MSFEISFIDLIEKYLEDRGIDIKSGLCVVHNRIDLHNDNISQWTYSIPPPSGYDLNQMIKNIEIVERWVIEKSKRPVPPKPTVVSVSTADLVEIPLVMYYVEDRKLFMIKIKDGEVIEF